MIDTELYALLGVETRPAPRACADCGVRLDVLAPSIHDATRCMRCAPAARYAWKQCPIGRYRRVSPREAASWKK